MKKLFFSLSFCILLFSFIQINPTAKNAFDQGNDLYKKGRYKEALVEINLAIKLDSLFAEAYYVRSFIHRYLGEYKEGLLDMEHFIKLNKRNPEAYLELASIRKEVYQYNYTGGELQYAESDDIDKETLFKSINDVDLAILIDSTYAKAYYYKGGWLEYMGRCSEKLGIKNQKSSIFREAIQLYTKAIKLDSLNGSIFYNRANLKLELKDTIGAVCDFKKAVTLKDQNSKSIIDNLCHKIKNDSIRKGCCN
jgi:tetratricopeptide (TPR) repeat protein